MGRKILVVDDEPSINALVSRLLKSKGYDVCVAENGREALNRFDEDKPDLVITDIVMPDMEGIELISKLSKRNRAVPIIVMSGNIIGMNFLKTAKILGAKATLTKPFAAQTLIETVATALGGD